MLLEKAQEETDGSNPGKSSLKATLTEQIKEQEAICSSLKEVRYQTTNIHPYKTKPNEK